MRLRSKTIDKFAITSYNIYIIKQQINVWLNLAEGRMPFGERKEEAAERKRTARTATNQIPNL